MMINSSYVSLHDVENVLVGFNIATTNTFNICKTSIVCELAVSVVRLSTATSQLKGKW